MTAKFYPKPETLTTWNFNFSGLATLPQSKVPKKWSGNLQNLWSPLVCHFAFQLSTLLQSLKTVINFPETSEHRSKNQKRNNWNKQKPFSIETFSSSGQKTKKFGCYFPTRFQFMLQPKPSSFVGYPETTLTSKAFSEASDVPRPLGLAASKRGSWDRSKPKSAAPTMAHGIE